MYPYRKSYPIAATYTAIEDYDYSFNGMEKADEIGENIITSKYRNADLDINTWWSRDPKESENSSNSPYIMMGSNPVSLIDPNGDKEYESIAQYRRITGYRDLGPNDWLKKDRELMNERFSNANLYNLVNLMYDDYTEIEQRYAFYEWFQDLTEELGYQTSWAGAADKVAYDVEWLDMSISYLFFATNTELAKFANESNEAIFVDVFPKLKDLYLGPKLESEDARDWDFKTLAEEQYLIQSLYDNLTPESKDLLESIVNENHFIFYLGAGMFRAAGSFPNGLNVFEVEDRWEYGIKKYGIQLPFV